jgi:hypothetical protein
VSASPIARDPRVKDLRFAAGGLEAFLRDGRKISAPLSWYPRLQSASLSDQAVWTISPDGRSVHWPLIGEDVRVEDLLRPDT